MSKTKAIRNLIGFVLVDLGIEYAGAFLQKTVTAAYKFIFGAVDDTSAMSYQMMESLYEQSVVIKLLSLPNGWNLVLTLYRTGKLSTSSLVRASLLKGLAHGADIGFVSSERLKAVFAEADDEALVRDPGTLRDAKTMVYFELETRGLI